MAPSMIALRSSAWEIAWRTLQIVEGRLLVVDRQDGLALGRADDHLEARVGLDLGERSPAIEDREGLDVAGQQRRRRRPRRPAMMRNSALSSATGSPQ